MPLQRRRLETGFSQLYAFPDIIPGQDYQPDDNFFTTASLSFISAGDDHSLEDTASVSHSQGQDNHEILSQFYDHSLARHDDIRSSQLPSPSAKDAIPFETEGTTSFLSASRSFDTTYEGDTSIASVRPPLPGSAHLSDLEDVPRAKDLLALAPATVTVNIIAGVISISPPREVTTRWGRRVELVELLLGDDTRSGFGVTFWLPALDGKAPPTRDASQAVLSKLRRQDVVMLQNVALHVFRDKVHGQSLRKNLTKVHLMHRRKLDKEDEGGYYRLEHLKSNKTEMDPQLEKTRKVREWVLRFVGAGAGADAGATKTGKKRGASDMDVLDEPPEDTQ